jgi:enoyl-CoA hydratase/carnithine racemase
LGLLYAADIVVAADDAQFALGYGALGLTADGGNTSFLPRMMVMRRAQETLPDQPAPYGPGSVHLWIGFAPRA